MHRKMKKFYNSAVMVINLAASISSSAYRIVTAYRDKNFPEKTSLEFINCDYFCKCDLNVSASVGLGKAGFFINWLFEFQRILRSVQR